MFREKTIDRARGRWAGVLQAVGIPSTALRNKQGPCPMCGGRTRFRFDDKGGNGTWICNTADCGAGNGLKLVQKFKGLDFPAAAKLVDQLLGEAPASVQAQPTEASSDRSREEMRKLWDRAQPITLADPAGKYLNRRLGLTEFPSVLRYAPDERYYEADHKPSWHPALIAKVDPSDAARAEGQRAALHRTYLDRTGNKADVATVRKMMGAMPDGAAVRLFPHADVLGIAEGIETALSAAALEGIPVWSALTAGLLQLWTPPPDVKVVMIFADNDTKFAGQAAAYALGARLANAGLSAFVQVPPKVGTDWNDVLLARKAA